MTDGTLTDVAARDSHALPDPYGIDDWPGFFGRDDEARAAAALWRDERITILYGRSGIGKTSLLQAGVVHLMHQLNADILPVGNLAHRSAFSTIPLFEYNPFTLAVLSSWAPLETSALLSTMTVSDFVRRRERMTIASTTLAVIDQAENLFYGSEAMQRYRKEFLNDLVEALQNHPHLHILLVIRDSYLQNLLSDNFLPPKAWEQLQGLERKEAVKIVRHALDGTDRLAGHSDAEELAEELVDKLLNTQIVDSYGNQATLRESRVHPAYLHEVTRRTQDVLPRDTTKITEARLQRLLDVDGWLAEFICRSVIRISRYHERDPGRLCAWLARTFITAEGSPVAVNDDNGLAAGMPTSILLSLEDQRVLRSELRSGSRSFELQSTRLTKPLQLAAEIISAFIDTASPPNYADHLDDAIIAFSRGELECAERHAERALQFSSEVSRPDQAQVETLLGNIACQHGDTKRARHHYLNAAKLLEATQNKPAVGRLLAAIGRLYLMELDTTTAIRTLRSALDRAPADNFIRIELARALAASGEGDDAVALLEAVLTSEDNRDVDDARILRGEIRADLGDPNALSDLERPPRSDRPSARASRAVILARLGQFAEAEEAIKQALDMAGDSGPVLLRAAQIQALRGDRINAAQLARKSIDATGIPLNQHQRQQADGLLEKRHN